MEFWFINKTGNKTFEKPSYMCAVLPLLLFFLPVFARNTTVAEAAFILWFLIPGWSDCWICFAGRLQRNQRMRWAKRLTRLHCHAWYALLLRSFVRVFTSDCDNVTSLCDNRNVGHWNLPCGHLLCRKLGRPWGCDACCLCVAHHIPSLSPALHHFFMTPDIFVWLTWDSRIWSFAVRLETTRQLVRVAWNLATSCFPNFETDTENRSASE